MILLEQPTVRRLRLSGDKLLTRKDSWGNFRSE